MALLFGIGLLGKLLEQSADSASRTLPSPRRPAHRICPLGDRPRPLISNTIGVARIFRPGVATYELWLKLGIVLVGAKFLLQDVLHIGGFRWCWSPSS